MRKHLGWIVVAAFAAAALFLGGAWMLSGGGEMGEIFARYSGFNHPFCSGQLAGEQASREIAWQDGERVSINMPATVHYRPGDDGAVKIVGDKALISHVRIDQGEIGLDCRPGRMKASLDITLPGRTFRTFSLAGLTSLILNDIDQRELNINLAGSSSVSADGKAESLSVNAAGLSDAKLGGLQVEDAELNLAGKSGIEVSVRDELEINAIGAATVVLLTEPRHVQTNIVGSGRVIHKAL